MLALYTTDINGFGVSLEHYHNLIDALAAFEMFKHDFTVGHIELIDETNPQESLSIKEHTTLWAMD